MTQQDDHDHSRGEEPVESPARFTNRLIQETSPYLLQHAHNPFDWYPWGPEALARAQAEDRPILLSVGYAACHWCHVMAHESFESERIATMMNLQFVCVKVDREERPDVDALYMEAVQALTGRGGWPMTVFLTPAGLPFFAGTYFPPEDRYGMPGFPTLLRRISELYRNRRADVDAQAEEFRAFYEQRASLDSLRARALRVASGEVDTSILEAALRGLKDAFDMTQGGFGGAPKFPHAMDLEFLLRMHLRSQRQAPRPTRVTVLGTAAKQIEMTPLVMVTRTLDKMAAGGIYDHLGGGFHRYAVDDHWLVPHFEKMLYDNALLARVALHTYQVTGQERYARVCREILDYVRREMTGLEGGFYSTQDADSEGAEGAFYLWNPREIGAVLDEDDALLWMAVYGVTPEGNFEDSGDSVPHVTRPVAEVALERGLEPAEAERRLADARLALFTARSRRVWPALDDKILTVWNGLMMRAFAEAANVFSSATYAEVARNNAEFLLNHLLDDQGRVLRSYRSGQSKIAGFLEDYASLALGLLATYEATFELRWFVAAKETIDHMLERFSDEDGVGFYDTASDHEQLIGRPRELMDNATPSGTSLAVEALLWLAALTGEQQYHARATQLLTVLAPAMAQQPLAFGNLLCALDRWLSPSQEIAIIGDPLSDMAQPLLSTVRGRFRPHTVVACAGPEDAAARQVIPLLADRSMVDDRPTVYVCEQFTCQMPVVNPVALAETLGDV